MDIDNALSEIGQIRDQLAASTRFRGFTPAIVAATGVLAVTLAAAQSIQSDSMQNVELLLHQWILLAFISVALIGIDAVVRARQIHRAMADTLIHTALRQFFPAGAVGAVCAIVVLSHATDNAWLLPGLWQLLVAVGIFAALPNLPRTMVLAAAWYFAAGALCLGVLAVDRSVSPWAMGVPFGVGQLLTAAILKHACRSNPDA